MDEEDETATVHLKNMYGGRGGGEREREREKKKRGRGR